MTEIPKGEECPVILGVFIVKHEATVRQTARQFGISKSTVYTDVTNWNCLSPFYG